MLPLPDEAAAPATSSFDISTGTPPYDTLFLHANGFPPGSYRALFAALKQAGVELHAPAQRPLRSAEVPRHLDWQSFADDLLETVAGPGVAAPVTLIGHSLGGVVAVMAAAQAPDRFARLILLDPTILNAASIRLWRIWERAVPERRALVRRTLSRPREFSSRATAFDFHRSKRPYAAISDAVLRDYIDAVFVDEGTAGVRLAYLPEWEAAIYASVPDVWELVARCPVPTQVMRGEFSTTLTASAAERIAAVNSGFAVEQVSGYGHLLPLEGPVRVAERIVEALA